MLLTARGICKRYGKTVVLDGVGFHVREGEVLGLIGPNGAGKTTLFECLAGLMPATNGITRFQNAELSPQRRRDHLFYLPDAILPWTGQRVRWVLNFFADLHRGASTKLSSLIEPLRLVE